MLLYIHQGITCCSNELEKSHQRCVLNNRKIKLIMVGIESINMFTNKWLLWAIGFIYYQFAKWNSTFSCPILSLFCFKLKSYVVIIGLWCIFYWLWHHHHRHPSLSLTINNASEKNLAKIEVTKYFPKLVSSIFNFCVPNGNLLNNHSCF